MIAHEIFNPSYSEAQLVFIWAGTPITFVMKAGISWFICLILLFQLKKKIGHVDGLQKAAPPTTPLELEKMLQPQWSHSVTSLDFNFVLVSWFKNQSILLYQLHDDKS